MLNTSWARGAAAASLLAAAAVPALAAPVVVDFESAFTIVGPTQSETSYSESGFTFTPVGGDAVLAPSACDPALGELCALGNTSTVLSALNDAEVGLTHARVFSLGTFSASFVPFPDVDFFSGATVRLRLDGVSATGAAVNMAVELNHDASDPASFVFGIYDASALGMLRSLQFSMVCFDNSASCDTSPFLNDSRFALDNLSLTVPEPGAAWLVALCLTGLALTRRRAR